jgi:hypothetical protein
LGDSSCEFIALQALSVMTVIANVFTGGAASGAQKAAVTAVDTAAKAVKAAGDANTVATSAAILANLVIAAVAAAKDNLASVTNTDVANQVYSVDH